MSSATSAPARRRKAFAQALAAVERPRTLEQGGDIGDLVPSVGAIAIREKFGQGNIVEIRIAVVTLAVREGELERLRHQMGKGRAIRIEPSQIIALEHLQHLQQHRPLGPGPALPDLPAVVIDADRGFGARAPARHVLPGQHAFAPRAAAVHDTGLAQVAVDGVGDEPFVEGPARRLDLRLAAGDGLRLIQQALPEGGEIGVSEKTPGLRHIATG